MTYVLERDGVLARSAVKPDEPARYRTREDAEIAKRHAVSKGWRVVEEVPE